MAVVKANGYGHGAVEVSRRAVANGADWLGVARFDEALALRREGLEAPILIFGHTPARLAEALIENRLTQTVYSVETATKLCRQARAVGKRLPVHLKIDTGMGRLGVLAEPFEETGAKPLEGVEAVADIARLDGLQVEGIYTHFASADHADKASAHRQLERFLAFVERLRAAGLVFDLVHAANSAALLGMPGSHLDMVRVGIAAYGLSPSPEVPVGEAGLEPVMQLKTRIVHLKRVPAGFAVSYGGTYRTAAPTTIATVAIGYGDGLSRRLSSRGHMLVRGTRVPIVGRVCMDLTMLDVGGLPESRVGDEAVVFGRQGDQAIAMDELSTLAGTINYEIATSIAERVSRSHLG